MRKGRKRRREERRGGSGGREERKEVGSRGEKREGGSQRERKKIYRKIMGNILDLNNYYIHTRFKKYHSFMKEVIYGDKFISL